jgi:hypothetical protein
MAKPLTKAEASEVLRFLKTVKPHGFDDEDRLIHLVSRLQDISGQKTAPTTH